MKMAIQKFPIINLSVIAIISWLLLFESSRCSGQSTDTNKYNANINFNKAITDIDNYLTATGVSGGILIAKNGKVALRKGYGLANERLRVSMTSHSVFYIGSVTKQFTAAAILKLEEQRKLIVTDSITKFFKDVPVDKQNITIHQLLTHSAGFAHDIFEYGEEKPTKTEVLAKTWASKLKFEPGKKYAYSNIGYDLLAIIIEIASGTTYESYLSENFFKPVGMMKTGILISRFTENDIVLGYDISGELPRNPDWYINGIPNWPARGAGSMLSTLEDLYKWHLALEGEKVLSNKSKQKLFTSYIPEDTKGSSYSGYGWGIFKTSRGTKLIAHDGSNGIFFADFHRYVDEDVAVIYFTNERNTISKAIFTAIPDLVFGKELPDFPQPKIYLSTSELNKYAGKYQLPSGEQFMLQINNNTLETTAMNLGVVQLLTSFPELQGKEKINILEQQANSVLQSIIRGNFETLIDSMYYEGNFEEEKEYWKDKLSHWTGRFGEYQNSEVIGTIQESSTLITYIFLQFERGGAIVQCRHRENKKISFGPSNLIVPSHYRFIPKLKAEFEVYNATLKTSTVVNFVFNRTNAIYGLNTQISNKRIYAKKTGRNGTSDNVND